MKLYNIRSRTGFCVYSENGSDCNKFINALRNSSVQFYGLTMIHSRLYGYVRSMDFSRLCSIAESHKLVCRMQERKGVFYTTKGYHKRYGLIIGMVLSLGLISFLSDRVMIIEIGGNTSKSETHVISLLRDAGIYIGSSISDIDLRYAERQIKRMDKDIDWIGIRNTGSRVVVEIEDITNPPEMERKNTPCNIVAARDAQIKSVRVYNGMLIPMVGDGVKKGDVIISGVVDTQYGRSYYVHSIGEITGIYSDRMTFSQPLECEETVYTGEMIRKAVNIFGLTIPLDMEKPPEGEYEYYEESFPLRLGKITFPISKKIMHYKLTDKVTVTRTQEEADAQLQERIERFESNLMNDCTITDRQVSRQVTDKAVTVTISYTLEGEIGREQQLFARYEGFKEKGIDDREEEQP